MVAINQNNGLTSKPIFVGKNYTENQFNTGHNIHICNRRGFLLRRQFSGSRKFCAGSELKTAQELGIETLVAIPDISSASMAPDHAYNVCEFSFNAEQNCYTCPQGHTLITNGNWYKKETLVIATHGFIKKVDKVPANEIDRAVRLKGKYFKNKTNK